MKKKVIMLSMLTITAAMLTENRPTLKEIPVPQMIRENRSQR